MLLNNTDERVEEEKFPFGYFLVFVGLWPIGAIIKGALQRDFWSEGVNDSLEGAPFLVSYYTNLNRFESILYSFKYTSALI